MNDRNVITYQGKAIGKVAKYFFTGSGALYEGQALCFDADRGTAGSVDSTRGGYVELPSVTNNNNFAGTCIQDYSAVTGGQEVLVYTPGAVGMVRVLEAGTINATRMNCCVVGTGVTGVGGSFFIGQGHAGRGTAKLLQTITALTASTDAGPGVLTSSLDGSATWTAASRTVTKTAAFANVAVGDKVVVVAGLDTAATATPVTFGEYTVESKTSDDAVVVTTSMAAADSEIAFYLIRGNPTAYAYLEDGDESGCVQWLTPDTGAVTQTVGGRTIAFGGFDLQTADATFTLADGTYVGQLKSIKLQAALATNDYLVTLATTGEQLDGTTDLASLEFDGAGDESVLIWGGAYWRLLVNKGTGLA